MMPSCMAEEVALGLHIYKDYNMIIGTSLLIKPYSLRLPRNPALQCTALCRSAGSNPGIQSMPTPDSATLNAIFRKSHNERRQDQAVPVRKITVKPSPARKRSLGLTHVSVSASLHSPHRHLPISLLTRSVWLPRRTDHVTPASSP